MTDAERVEQLRRTLKPVLDWYKKVLEEGEPDGSYLYDMTWEVFNDNLSRGQFQDICEALL